VAITGDIMTMPGLPKVPAAEKIDIDENGVITGLFLGFSSHWALNFFLLNNFIEQFY